MRSHHPQANRSRRLLLLLYSRRVVSHFSVVAQLRRRRRVVETRHALRPLGSVSITKRHCARSFDGYVMIFIIRVHDVCVNNKRTCYVLNTRATLRYTAITHGCNRHGRNFSQLLFYTRVHYSPFFYFFLFVFKK